METLVDFCDRLREEILAIVKQVDSARRNESLEEVGANLTLSLRHLEDARMRLGKAIQANGDGVSVLDKMTPAERDKFNARKKQ